MYKWPLKTRWGHRCTGKRDREDRGGSWGDMVVRQGALRFAISLQPYPDWKSQATEPRLQRKQGPISASLSSSGLWTLLENSRCLKSSSWFWQFSCSTLYILWLRVWLSFLNNNYNKLYRAFKRTTHMVGVFILYFLQKFALSIQVIIRIAVSRIWDANSWALLPLCV